MKKLFVRALAGLLTAGVMVCPSMAASPFPDVDANADYAEAVSYVSEVGIMVGDENGNFNPDKTVTRAEMAVILCNMLGETENLTAGGSVFTDVPANHWANRYVVKAAELGLVTGYGDGRFGPVDVVTYEQAVTMVVNSIYGSEEANREGGYPDGYLKIAEIDGLVDNLDCKKGDTLSRGMVAIILFNCNNSFL